jgi:hypothetical protein
MQVVDLISTESESKFGPAQRMATAIVEIYREQGGCFTTGPSEQGLHQ